MNILLDTDAILLFIKPGFRVETDPAQSGLTSLTDILRRVFTSHPCSVCTANDLPTVGPTYHDAETNGHFCLGCLELVCDPLPDLAPDQEPDPETEAMACEVVAARRAARTARK